jgi:hypothetical protein
MKQLNLKLNSLDAFIESKTTSEKVNHDDKLDELHTQFRKFEQKANESIGVKIELVNL